MTVIVTTRLETEYDEFKLRMPKLKERAQEAVTEMAAGAVEADFIRGLYRSLARERTYLTDFKDLTGITQFVKDTEDNQTYNIVTEVTAIISAIQDTIDQVDSDFPSSGTPPNRYRLFVKMEDGVDSLRSFGTTGTANLRTDLTAIAALIGSV